MVKHHLKKFHLGSNIHIRNKYALSTQRKYIVIINVDYKH